MSSQKKQKKYLKKYMSKEDKIKKRSHAAPIGSTRVKIIDDDVDIRKIQVEDEDELILSGDEAPQIVGVTSASSPVPRAINDFRHSGKWKNLSGKHESDHPTDSLTEKTMFSKKISEKLKLFHHGNLKDAKSHKIGFSRKSRNEQDGAGVSKVDSDNSPPRKPSVKMSDDSDYSPPRKNNSSKTKQSPSNKYQTPPRNSPPKRRSSDDYSPPRKSDKSSKKYGAAPSTHHDKSDSDYSPKRSSSKFQDKNSGYSPNRRTSKDLSDHDYSPPRRSAKNKNSDILPPKQSKHIAHSTKSLKKDRRSESSDYSPPRKKDSNREDLSHPRKKNNSNRDDLSPPRKKNNSNREDLSPPRKAGLGESKSSDFSPPRRSQKKYSSVDKESRSNAIHRGRDKSPRRRSKDKSPRRRSRDRSSGRRSNERSKRESSFHSNTEDNKSSFGLRKGGTEDKKRQNPFSKDSYENMPDKDQELMTRNRRRIPDEAKEKAREEKLRREQEKQELYSKWNRGLRQIEDYKTKAADDKKEADKPLARYANDEDLDNMLKQQERIGDPMLDYMREKQREKRKQDKVLEFPTYKGIVPENRFQIRPGYRWDGVDRSNGYEKKWFDFQSEKRANIEESYKYDEDYM